MPSEGITAESPAVESVGNEDKSPAPSAEAREPASQAATGVIKSLISSIPDHATQSPTSTDLVTRPAAPAAIVIGAAMGRRLPGPSSSANAALGRPPSEMSATTSEAMSVLRRREVRRSWCNPFLSDEQRDALKFIKEKADGMQQGVMRLTDAFAPGMEGCMKRRRRGLGADEKLEIILVVEYGRECTESPAGRP